MSLYKHCLNLVQYKAVLCQTDKICFLIINTQKSGVSFLMMENLMQEKLNQNKIYILFTIVCTAVIILINYALLGVFPFGESSMLTFDLNGQYVNFYSSFTNAVLNDDAGLFYSLEKGLGGSTIGLITYYCSSLFGFIFLLFPKDSITYAIDLIIALKIILCSATMCFFLLKRQNSTEKSNKLFTVILSASYAFCGYNMALYQHIMWIDALIYLPVICYGIDVLIKKNNLFIFIISLALLIFSNFYIAYMVCVFVSLYFLYELILSENNIKDKLLKCAVFCFSALIAAGLTAFLLLPGLSDILSNNSFIDYSLSLQSNFKITEFFHMLMPFSFTWENITINELTNFKLLPNVFSGCFTLVLAMVYFCNSKVKIKRKVLSFVFLSIIFLMFYSRDLFFAMHAFEEPTFFYYRYSFLFTFLLCFFAGENLAYECEFKIKNIILTSICLLSFLAICFYVRHVWFTFTFFLIGAFLCVFMLCLFFLQTHVKLKKYKFCFSLLILAVSLLEITANSYHVLNQFEKYSHNGISEYVSEFNLAHELIQQNETEQNSENLYRSEKTFRRTENDAMLLNYNGFSHYSSVMENTSKDALYSLGINDYTSSIFAQSVLALKYVYTRTDESTLPYAQQAEQHNDYIPSFYKFVAETDNIKIYQNPYALPLSFYTNENVLNTNNIDSFQNYFISQNQIFNAFNKESKELFVPVEQQHINVTNDGVIVENTMQNQNIIFSQSVNFEFTAHTQGYLYAYINTNENPVALTYNDATDANLQNLTGTNYIAIGECENGEKIDISLNSIDGQSEISEYQFFIMDKQMLLDFSENANKNSPELIEHNNAFEITANSNNGAYIVVSIPYDDNFNIEINEEKAQAHPIINSSFFAIELQDGENNITIKYVPKNLYLGLVISCFSFLLLVLICLMYHKIKKSKTC